MPPADSYPAWPGHPFLSTHMFSSCPTPAPTLSAFLSLALLNYNPEYLPASLLPGQQLHGTYGSSGLRLHLSVKTSITILVSKLDSSTATDVLRWAGGLRAMPCISWCRIHSPVPSQNCGPHFFSFPSLSPSLLSSLLQAAGCSKRANFPYL